MAFRSLAPLRHRRFAVLWSAAFCSNVGTWMETVAVGILVTQRTGEAQWAGYAAAAGFLPSALLSAFSGTLADRFRRHRIVMLTSSVQVMFAGALTMLAAYDRAEPWIVVLIVFGSGSANAIGLPAYQAIIPELVPREDLPGAIALGTMQWNLGRVVGPALAGIVIAVGGFEWAFAINTVSFFAVIAAIAPLRLSAPIRTGAESIWASLRRGIDYATREPGIRALLVYCALTSFFAAPFIGLVPAMALKAFGQEATGTAVLVTAQGLGAVAMALSLGELTERFGSRHAFLGGLAVLPAVLVGYAVAPTLAWGAVAIFVLGALYVLCLTSYIALAQLRAPNELRGRVLALFLTTLGLLYPLGSALQGIVADHLDIRTTTAAGAIALALSLLAIRLTHPGFDRALADVTLHPLEAGLSGSPSRSETHSKPHSRPRE